MRDRDATGAFGWLMVGIVLASGAASCSYRPLPVAPHEGSAGGQRGVSDDGGAAGSGGGQAGRGAGGAPGTGGRGAGGATGAGGAVCVDPSCAPGHITEFKLPARITHADPYAITSGPDGNLWFTEFQGGIGRITPAGVITEFPVAPTTRPLEIAAGPDKHMWFTAADTIGRISLDGDLTEFPLSSGSGPAGITAGPDGNIWFTEGTADRIGRIRPDGTLTEFPIPSAGSMAYGITTGADGDLWFTEPGVGRIATLSPAGVVREWPSATRVTAHQAVLASDGNIWFTAPNIDQLGKISPSGVVTLFPTPTALARLPWAIARGPHGDLWYTRYLEPDRTGELARLALDGTVTEYPLAHATQGGATALLVMGVTTGPDGNIWFTETADDMIAKMVPPN